jgi:hypothetical protein
MSDYWNFEKLIEIYFLHQVVSNKILRINYWSLTIITNFRYVICKVLQQINIFYWFYLSLFLECMLRVSLVSSILLCIVLCIISMHTRIVFQSFILVYIFT